MKPIFERILVKPVEQEKKTNGGLLLPAEARKRPNIGEVISTGDGIPTNPMPVKPGDKILFNRYAGLELKYNGEIHFIIMTNEVICVLEESDNISFEGLGGHH